MLSPATEQNGPRRDAAWNELRPVLHEEVNRLPERYRIPVILRYLEGKTDEEVALLLRWSVGTVKGRLSSARVRLRSRLIRRGMAHSAAFLVTALSDGVVFAEIVPADLVQRTVCFVDKFGPRSISPDRSSVVAHQPNGPRRPDRVQARVGAARIPRKLTPPPRLIWLSLLSASAVIGIGLAVHFGGNAARLQSTLSAWFSTRATGASGP